MGRERIFTKNPRLNSRVTKRNYFTARFWELGGPRIRETKDTVRVSLQEYLFTGSSKVSSCGFWQKRVRLSNLLEGGLVALQEPTLKAFSPKRGLVFAVNGASAPPPPKFPGPSPPPPFLLGGGGGFTENPRGRGSSRRGGGARGVHGEFGGGGAPSPIYGENEPPFRRKRLLNSTLGFA